MARIVAARRASAAAACATARGTGTCGRRAALAALLGAAATSTGCAWLVEQQNRAALRPTTKRPAHLPDDDLLFRPGDVRERVPVPAGPHGPPGAQHELSLWWLPHEDSSAPALLYLHGTFRNLWGNWPKIDAQRRAGFSVLAVDYRGWGESTPIVPDEESIAADTRRAWDELRARQPDPARRWIFGHSMGGAAAVRLAAGLRGGVDYAGLILESTFTRMPDIAAAVGFWGRVAAQVTTLEFDSLSRIGRIDAPILMMHGTADDTVPIALGRRLRDAAPPGVRWVEFEGGNHSWLHRDFPERYAQTLRGFVFAPAERLPPAAPGAAAARGTAAEPATR
ncbi:MAG: lysophospholipase [Rubrivivax sp.]|jgi:hypothetical protein|nr:lysophospholipase [Rubrivivax sp.]